MPGSGKQTAHVQQQIIEFLEAGIDPTTIHRRLKVGRSSIYRMKRCLQQHGTAYAPPETNKKNGRPKVMTAEQEYEIRTWLQDPHNRNRYLDDMVWFIHDRFGMVCSTTTCSKIKRKWLKVIEAEERGELLDPAEAQEQVRQEAFRVGKKPVSGEDPNAVMHRQKQRQQQNDVASSTSLSLSSSPLQAHLPVGLEMAMQQHHHHHQQQQQQRQQQPQYAPQIDRNLLHEFKPQMDQHLQKHLHTEVAHAALSQHQAGV